ncbi:type IX secretion system protein PorD [Luteibaculum oceani]|uniref:DUF4835 family protein n=1 Tax=Luteibaculum oceani TaxID=1294296 RepID=A0A5C6UU65_9FLAO|nr:DUF4835 family protein [Luteibaculum oceani]TXC76150.1 DUF4835 family protein [Luteibaculum oceani]
MTFKLPLKTGFLLSILAFTLFLPHIAWGQELNATVQVTYERVKAQATNPRIFETLERTAQEFLNNTKWGGDDFQLEERIQCSFLFTIDKISGNTYEGSIQVTSSRPVFNSNYSTTLLNHKDNDFTFSYTENAPIIFTPNQFKDNLSSVLAYYAYLVLAMDYDSFSREGGKAYFTLAQRVVANAQNAGFDGWRSSEGVRNRFWIVDNALQEAFKPIRDCVYEYHRQGLDQMYSNTEDARKTIIEALKKLERVHAVKPLSINMQIFFNAKSQEIINIFDASPAQEKESLLSLLGKLDPSNLSKYQKLVD